VARFCFYDLLLYFPQQGNTYIQSKAHLMFWYALSKHLVIIIDKLCPCSYSLNVLFFLQLNGISEHDNGHPVVERMRIFYDVSFGHLQFVSTPNFGPQFFFFFFKESKIFPIPIRNLCGKNLVHSHNLRLKALFTFSTSIFLLLYSYLTTHYQDFFS
jgi:hypothetical protein